MGWQQSAREAKSRFSAALPKKMSDSLLRNRAPDFEAPRRTLRSHEGDVAHKDQEGPAAGTAAPPPLASPTSRARRLAFILSEHGALCAAHVVLNTSGPIMLQWVKVQNGGKYPFSAAALTFHAYGTAVLMGLAWVSLQGAAGLRQLAQFGMLVRFCGLACLFAGSDTLSVMSMQHLDPGTFSLVGKALAMVLTVALSYAILGRKQTQAQYRLLVAIVLSTLAFLRSEVRGRDAASTVAASATDRGSGLWAYGLTQRVVATSLSALAAVLQERMLQGEAGIPFMLQQSWMGLGALTTTFAAWRYSHGLPISRLLDGFDDWRALLLLATYTLNGLLTGLMVKRLGAVAKALCVPIHLGSCYIYAVSTGTATLELQALLFWLLSTALVVVFGLSKALAGCHRPVPAATAK
mmetsp:Transcript_45547/g.114768  ORF Transcript_45547/g.114768 Transcript_45547/m.114768 type:complete len:408 (+) Transcript_45547:95-1318(+)